MIFLDLSADNASALFGEESMPETRALCNYCLLCKQCCNCPHFDEEGECDGCLEEKEEEEQEDGTED